MSDNQNSASARPNILLIIADQWRGQATGYQGDPNAVTPNLDRLASEGINFRTALSAHPLCVPFRGALLTGQHAHVNGVQGHYSSLPANARTVAHDFVENGYHTAWFGKWHLSEHRLRPGREGGRRNALKLATQIVPEDRRGGFQHWEAFESNGGHQDPWLHTDEDPVARQRPGYQPDVLADAFQSHINTVDAGVPWFAVISCEPPHNPYHDAPPEFLYRYRPEEIVLRPNVPSGTSMEARVRLDLAGYYAHIEAIDDTIGRLLRYLDDRGLSDNTVVVFLSDHGDLLGSHGLYMKSRPLEESVRIPLLMRWPGHIPAGLVSDALITEVDLAPTFLGLLDVPARTSMQGEDLSPVALGKSVDGPSCALLQHVLPHGHEHAIRLPWRAIRTSDVMYGCTPSQEQWLFDLAQDPYETRNLALVSGARELRERMWHELRDALDAVGDPFVLPKQFEPEDPEPPA